MLAIQKIKRKSEKLHGIKIRKNSNSKRKFLIDINFRGSDHCSYFMLYERSQVHLFVRPDRGEDGGRKKMVTWLVYDRFRPTISYIFNAEKTLRKMTAEFSGKATVIKKNRRVKLQTASTSGLNQTAIPTSIPKLKHLCGFRGFLRYWKANRKKIWRGMAGRGEKYDRKMIFEKKNPRRRDVYHVK